jgi:F-type H+-transporting ATPase subunit b
MVFLLTIFNNGIDPDAIENSLIPTSIWPFIIQLLSTFVFLLIVKKFLYAPIKGIIDKRADFVKKTIDDATEKEKQANLLKISLEQETKKVQQSLKKLREEAIEELNLTKAQMLQDAQGDVLRLKQKANEEILQAKQQVIADIEAQIISVALDASKQVLQRELTKKDNDKVVEDFIKGMRQ